MKKLLQIVICFLPVMGMAQANQLRLKSTLTGGAANTLTYNHQGKTIVIQQCIGQMGNIGVVAQAELQLQQGFLSHYRTLNKENSTDPLGTDIQIRVYPNPVVDRLNVNFNEKVDGPIGLALFDMTGRRLLAKTFTSSDTLQLKVGHLQEATYLLKLTARSQEWGGKIIKTSR